MPNSYIALAKLSTHPAFSMSRACLVCPLCKTFTTTRAAEYDKHFFTHNPTDKQIQELCSGKTYDRWKRGAQLRDLTVRFPQHKWVQKKYDLPYCKRCMASHFTPQWPCEPLPKRKVNV